MKINYDGTIGVHEDYEEDETRYEYSASIYDNDNIPALTNAALWHLLTTSVKGMNYGGSCHLSYDVYVENGMLHCALTVRDMETEFGLDVIEDDDEEAEGFFSKLKRLIGIGG